MVETQTSHKVKVLQSDNGGEYTSKAFDALFSKHGIVRQTSALYTLQQNGVAEYANRIIVEMARCMLYAQGLGREFWAEAVSNAVYTYNRCPNKALVDVTPEEAWSGKRPCISFICVFGCIAYAKVPDEKRTKLNAKDIKCLFVGYCEGTKAYRLVCLESQKIIKSPDVVFFEDKRLSEEGPSGSIGQEPLEVDHSSKSDDDDDDEDLEVKTKSSEEKNFSTTQVEANEDNTITRPSIEQTSSPNEGNATLGGSRYPSRVRKPLGEWWMNHILPPRDVEHTNVVMHDEPHTMTEAMQSGDAKKWELAMQEEYDSLMANGTWELTPLSKNRQSVGCKWVFRTKRDASGNVVRYKARLVAKGYSQVAGVDFNETFAPVAKFSTIRCILALGAIMDLQMHQMDVKTAFLNGDLEEDIYMDQPQGFVQGDMVCKLKKSLYGLKQSPRAWYEYIHAFFVKEGLIRSHVDHSLYVVQSSTHIVIVIIYVDDLIILASDMTKLMEFKAKLEKEFDMSDLGELHFFLGVQIERNRAARNLTMHQKSSIEGVLSRFGMEECKPLATPLDVKAIFVKPS